MPLARFEHATPSLGGHISAGCLDVSAPIRALADRVRSAVPMLDDSIPPTHEEEQPLRMLHELTGCYVPLGGAMH